MTQIPDKNDLQEENFILAHDLRGSVHGGSKARQDIMVEGLTGGTLLTSWNLGCRQRKGKVNTSEYTPSDPPSPALPHLPIVRT